MLKRSSTAFRPCLHGVGDPGLGRFLLFCVAQTVKTKETNPTRPGSPTPRKQALNLFLLPLKYHVHDLSARISAEHASYFGRKGRALALLTFLSNVNKRQYR